MNIISSAGPEHSALTIALQPVFNACAPGQVSFFETLLRVTHTADDLFHVKLLSMAEDMGFVHLLDQQIINLVVPVLEKSPFMRMSVNVSQRSILQDGQQILRQLAESGVTERIIVEITESTRIPTSWVKAFAGGVREIGCQLAIDDFETGYADDVLVRAVRPHFIKVVIDDTSAQSRDQILRAVSLAREVGASVVGEKIDTPEKAQMAVILGIAHLQGFLLSHPFYVNRLDEFLGHASHAPVALDEGLTPEIRLDRPLNLKPLHSHTKIRLVEKTGS